MTLLSYLLRQLLVAVAFALGGMALFVLPTITIQAVHKLGGVGIFLLLEYLPLTILQIVPYLLPMAFLLGIVVVFGRLASDKEFIAIRMAGIHPGRLLMPGFVVALPFALGTHWLLAEYLPDWKYLQRITLRQASESNVLSLGYGRTEFEFGDFYLKAEEREGSTFWRVVLNLPRPEGDVTIMADEVTVSVLEESLAFDWKNAQVLLENGWIQNERPGARIPLSDILRHRPIERSQAKYMPTSEIRASLAKGLVEPDEEKTFRYEIHRRSALSCIFFVFLLLGVPTGLHLKSSTQLGAFSGAVGYAFVYYVLALRLGKELAAVGAVPAPVAAWATNVLFLGVGSWFAHRVLWR